MQLRHAHTLAKARTYLSVLADEASNDDVAAAYEHVLIDLDRIHCDESPDVYRDAVTQDRDIQYDVATAAIEDLKTHGVNPLAVELLLWHLAEAYHQDCT